MKRKKNWIIGVLLTATAGFFALQNGLTPGSVDSSITPTNTNISIIAITDTPTATSADEGCAYMWANHDAPELTGKLDAAIHSLNPKASANVSLYGEDCVYSDGKSTFGAMETDFYIHLVVDDLTNEKAFGNWMAQALPLITQIPREEIKGSYGFVEFWFEKTDKEKVVVRVPIQKYMDDAQAKNGAELFHMFNVIP
jgi:hypothetical protein